MATIQKIQRKGGTVYKITVSGGTDSTGKQIRRYMTWTPPQGLNARQISKEVKKVAYEFEHQFDTGMDVGNRQTFEAYSQYVIDLKSNPNREGGCKHNTIVLYKRLRTNLLPLIGSVPIRDFSSQRLNALYDILSQTKAKKWARQPDGELKSVETDRTLSPKTVKEYHNFISAVLEQAVQDRILPYNPAHSAKPPKRTKTKVRSYELEEITAIRQAAASEPLHWQVMINLFLVSGCRRGELAGLEWSRVDFEHSCMEISKNLCYTSERGIYVDTPKTATSARLVGLPPEMMEQLLRLRREQLEHRLMLGDRWTESDYVFTASEGGPINPSYITTYFRRFSQRHSLPHLNPHAFRHTCASQLIAKGNDIVVVAEMLGHAEASTTLNVYSHAIQESKKRAVACMSDLLQETDAGKGDKRAL